MNGIKRLGDAELEIMQIIWSHKTPMTANEILKNLKQRQWLLSTLITVLKRLVDKGFLSCDKTPRLNLFSAKISESSYNESESKIFLEKHYDSSIRRFVTSLCGTDAVSKEDLAELRSYLDDFVEGETDG